MPLGSHNSIQYGKPDNCIKGSRSNVMPVLFFMLAQLLLGAGGSPLFTLGTTYIDDHVKRESSSMYIGESEIQIHKHARVLMYLLYCYEFLMRSGTLN